MKFCEQLSASQMSKTKAVHSLLLFVKCELESTLYGLLYHLSSGFCRSGQFDGKPCKFGENTAVHHQGQWDSSYCTLCIHCPTTFLRLQATINAAVSAAEIVCVHHVWLCCTVCSEINMFDARTAACNVCVLNQSVVCVCVCVLCWVVERGWCTIQGGEWNAKIMRARCVASDSDLARIKK